MDQNLTQIWVIRSIGLKAFRSRFSKIYEEGSNAHVSSFFFQSFGFQTILLAFLLIQLRGVFKKYRDCISQELRVAAQFPLVGFKIPVLSLCILMHNFFTKIFVLLSGVSSAPCQGPSSHF